MKETSGETLGDEVLGEEMLKDDERVGHLHAVVGAHQAECFFRVLNKQKKMVFRNPIRPEID